MADDDQITVLIADDHVPTRALVAESLSEQGFHVVAGVGSAPEAVAAAHVYQPMVCLVDLNMPGQGLTAVRQISRELPDTAIVVFTVSRSDADLFEALRSGAGGYLLKDVDPDRLGDALRGVLVGEAPIPKRLVSKLIREFRFRDARRRLPLVDGREVKLTAKEWDVIDGLREGSSTKQIAEKMGVGPVTVRTHIAHIVAKLKVADREAALRLLDEA